MRADTNLQFITEKITELRTAILYSMSNDLIRLPNCLATALKVDEEGQLWFSCDRPAYPLEQCPESFPVNLHFYRKGSNFRMELSGKAVIVNGNFQGDPVQNKPILLRMLITNVAYTETREARKNRLDIVIEKIQQWVVNHIALPRPAKSVLHQLQAMNQSMVK